MNDSLPSSSPVRDVPRAEHIGSLLRPESVKAAVAASYGAGDTSILDDHRERGLEELSRVADEAITEAIARQEAAGLDAVTDGEFRRFLFVNSFYDAIGGLGAPTAPVVFHNARGEEHAFQGIPEVLRRMEKIDSPAAREVEFVARNTDRPVKATFPAGSWWVAPHVVGPGRSLPGYADIGDFVQHAISIERELIQDAIDAGASYIQLDFPTYIYLADPQVRNEVLPQLGVDPDDLLERCLEADRAVVAGLPDHVRYGLHLCRGNYRSSWMLDGSLDPVAEQMFELPYDSFLVEWDDPDREGDFSVLRHVPRGGPVVVLGVVSSKDPRVETEDEVLGRIDEAARYLDVEQLAVSPQCGFASAVQGNDLDEDAQWRKLEIVGRVADRLWPRG